MPSLGALEDLICVKVWNSDKNLSNKASIFPPVLFSPNNLAGITEVLFKTSRSPLQKCLPISLKTSCCFDSKATNNLESVLFFVGY